MGCEYQKDEFSCLNCKLERCVYDEEKKPRASPAKQENPKGQRLIQDDRWQKLKKYKPKKPYKRDYQKYRERFLKLPEERQAEIREKQKAYMKNYREHLSQEQRERYRETKREYMRRIRAEARQAV